MLGLKVNFLLLGKTCIGGTLWNYFLHQPSSFSYFYCFHIIYCINGYFQPMLFSPHFQNISPHLIFAQTWLCICLRKFRRKICQAYNLLTDHGGELGIIKWGRIFPCIQYCGDLIQKTKWSSSLLTFRQVQFSENLHKC